MVRISRLNSLPTGVVCAYGADFRRVEALLHAAAERPNGLPLEEKQIAPICAQVIAPSRAQVIQGRKTVLRHTPMEMTAGSWENTWSIWPGMTSKHSVPTDIRTMPKITDSHRVLRQRARSPAA